MLNTAFSLSVPVMLSRVDQSRVPALNHLVYLFDSIRRPSRRHPGRSEFFELRPQVLGLVTAPDGTEVREQVGQCFVANASAYVNPRGLIGIQSHSDPTGHYLKGKAMAAGQITRVFDHIRPASVSVFG
ncbi:unnamed protein product [Protopolystoma xenopodis]|uniref:Uncharacterized protein n=1 Tax=Protopolystoma xenopodis TaxID=117903 RepID=A0A448X8B3_9PLAT|nr:unnamed protein product [Protopolystoma xenopodis]